MLGDFVTSIAGDYINRIKSHMLLQRFIITCLTIIRRIALHLNILLANQKDEYELQYLSEMYKFHAPHDAQRNNIAFYTQIYCNVL
jgi:hypothetical protein